MTRNFQNNACDLRTKMAPL